MQSDADRSLTRAYPLDTLIAQTQAMIGTGCRRLSPTSQWPSLSWRWSRRSVVVDANDPACPAPTKFIGLVHELAQADRLASEHGWTVAAEAAPAPSPLPVRIFEQATVEQLLQAGAVVVCAGRGGGGGAPVTADSTGRPGGIEAVVDKASTAALLAVAVHADHLLALTGVAYGDGLCRDTGGDAVADPDSGPARRLAVPGRLLGPEDRRVRPVRSRDRTIRDDRLPHRRNRAAPRRRRHHRPAGAPTSTTAAHNNEPKADHEREARPVTVQDSHAGIVDAARHAPSVHNTQPWRFTSTVDGLDLWADRSRGLPVLDPDGRQLHLSCGAALLHARVAARALGLRPDVVLLPDPAEPDHLARLQLTPGPPADADELDLAGAIAHRHTSREAFAARSLPEPLIDALRLAAEREAAILRPVTSRDDLVELEVLLAHADRSEEADPAYRQELAAWVRSGPSNDGIPAAALPADAERGSALRLRDFQPDGQAVSPEQPPAAEHPDVVLLATAGDTPTSWLQAGQALGAVLLRGTAAGVVAQPLGQATDNTASRQRLGRALGMLGVPQLALRLGYPSQAGPGVPPVRTPRRGVADVLNTDGQTAPLNTAGHDGPPREVLVGVWDSPDAAATVGWAATQAATRGARLVVATVTGWPGDTPPSRPSRDSTKATLARFVEAAEKAHPELVPVSTQSLQGLPGPALVARSATAELLVLGAGTSGQHGHAAAGSVAAHCIAHAVCPTVVVPSPTPAGSEPTRSRAPAPHQPRSST